MLILNYIGRASYHDLLLYLLEFEFYFLGKQKNLHFYYCIQTTSI